MGLFGTVKNIAKPFVDAPSWIGVDVITRTTNMLADTAKEVFTVKKATNTETFDEAMHRLDLDDDYLSKRANHLLTTSLLFALLCVAVIVYAFYLLFVRATFIGTICALSVASLTAAQCFRYNFWYFQIKQRRLGCTFKDWFNHTVKRNKHDDSNPAA